MPSEVDEQILKMFESSKETYHRFQEKMDAWKCLYRNLRPLFPGCNMLPFGSSMTNFATEDSDLDLVLLLDKKVVASHRYPGSRQGVFSQSDMLDTLERCHEEIQKYNSVYSHMELINATVPILVLKDQTARNAIKVELSCSDELYNRDGTRNTHLLMCYSDLDRRVCPLVIVIKKWATFHLLLGTRNKRLSGYSLALMVVFYLQRCDPPVLPCLQAEHPVEYSKATPVTESLNYVFHLHNRFLRDFASSNSDSLSELLCNFLKFYAEFDFTQVISVRTGRHLKREDCVRFSEEKEDDSRQWYKEVMVEDPIYRYNITRATSNRDTWKRILDVFKESYQYYKVAKNLDRIFF